jgi:hypothetical protein
MSFSILLPWPQAKQPLQPVEAMLDLTWVVLGAGAFAIQLAPHDLGRVLLTLKGTSSQARHGFGCVAETPRTYARTGTRYSIRPATIRPVESIGPDRNVEN